MIVFHLQHYLICKFVFSEMQSLINIRFSGLGIKKKKIFFFSADHSHSRSDLRIDLQTTATPPFTALPDPPTRVVLSSAASGNNRHRPHPQIALLLALRLMLHLWQKHVHASDGVIGSAYLSRGCGLYL
jgi:hypothetical protein